MTSLTKTWNAVLAAALFFPCLQASQPEETNAKRVEILVSPTASSPEKIAASELSSFLSKLYPGNKFETRTAPAAGAAFTIQLGTPDSMPQLAKKIGREKLTEPESYVVTSEGDATGIVLGADPRGVMYGVYGLLEKLGCGFFLTGDFLPERLPGAFSFDDWDVANHPLTPERIVFNWHNFLSGCTSWNLEDWKLWVRQAQKGGYNAIMVHAYGNNPMFTFEFNGVTKEVGYLASSRHGRDWGVSHINDVRRGAAGFMFEDPVFGSEASKVPYDQRVQAKQRMMQEVFAWAEKRGVKINFALDVDTAGANPQAVIETLEEEDRIRIESSWVARPDTPGGYVYYKSQAEALLELYPQIDTLTLWRRRGPGFSSIWPLIQAGDMPSSWQKEYREVLDKLPNAADLKLLEFNFAVSKIVRAWRKALDELGRKDIEIATGCWQFEWLDAALPFLPDDVKLMPLDYKCMGRNGGELSNPELLEKLAANVEPGRLFPIIWAHHDDGAYIGAPLPYLKDLNDKLKACGAGGFGIIHWMTHPLDPYFTSHSRQTWANTGDEPSEATNGFVAERWFGSANKDVMATFLNKWISSMPTFARATTGAFIDHPVASYRGMTNLQSSRKERLALLESANTDAMTKQQRKQWQFFRDYEDFLPPLYDTQSAYDKAKKALEKGEMAQGREFMAASNPKQVTEQFANLIRARGTTRGEEGIVVSMNTRWIPWHVKIRQQLGMEPMRLNFGPTSHEALAQLSGIATTFIDSQGRLWSMRGAKETGCEVFVLPESTRLESISPGQGWAEEICRTGIESTKPIVIELFPDRLCANNDKSKHGLPDGEYRLTLLFVEPSGTAGGQRVMHVEVDGKQSRIDAIDIFQHTRGTNRVLKIECPLHISNGKTPELTLKPVKGKALICGLIVSPQLGPSSKKDG